MPATAAKDNLNAHSNINRVAQEQLPASVRKPTMKVLVESRLAEVRATTFRSHIAHDDGSVDTVLFYRQFTRFKGRGVAYMSAPEAKFLVESRQNRARMDAGDPWYWYPNGTAVPVPLDFDVKTFGPYTAPSTNDQAGLADPRTATAAAEIQVEREEALRDYNEQKAAAERGKGKK